MGWQAQLNNLSAGNNTSQNGYSPYAGRATAQFNGMKRTLPESLRLESQHPSKRPTPEPSNAGTPASSSVESFDVFDNSSADVSERARRRQAEAEARVKRQRESQLQDEQFARVLSQGQDRPRPSASSSSFMPNVQTTLNHTGSYNRPPPQPKPELDFSGLGNEWGGSPYRQEGTKPPSNYKQQPQTPNIKPEPSSSSSKQRQQLPHRPRPQVIDLTASDSDDEDVAEVAPTSFTPNNRAGKPTSNYPNAVQSVLPSQPRQPMPGSYPTLPLWYQGGNQYARRYDWMQANPAVARAISGIQNGMRSAAGTIGDTVSEFGNLINGHAHPWQSDTDGDDDDLVYGGSRQLHPGRTPYAGYMDLYQSRYDEISDNDPAKTMEEINNLLENIR